MKPIKSAMLPTQWWYQFQYFLNFDVLPGRIRSDVARQTEYPATFCNTCPIIDFIICLTSVLNSSTMIIEEKETNLLREREMGAKEVKYGCKPIMVENILKRGDLRSVKKKKNCPALSALSKCPKVKLIAAIYSLFIIYKSSGLIFYKTRRTWKTNVQEKWLLSYILNRHIRVKVTTHALCCIGKAGGIDECLLNIPYKKLDNEMALFWKAMIEKMYEELGAMEAGFFCLNRNKN
ncbi:50S ribosomal protein L28 [Nymphaea thermarum]|nr:50S ribosomal protein L28 [Nymphaea thermarum]